MHVTFAEATRVWARVAAQSFGGPAGQIAVMHRILVDEKKWVTETQFLHALNFCMLLPGPEAQQLATYIGWLLHGVRGGLVAGCLFVLPGYLAILGLSALYAGYHQVPLVQALFYGLKPAVLAVVVEAVFRVGKKALKNNLMRLIALAAFGSLFLFNLPYPLVVVGAALIGLFGNRLWPARFQVLRGHQVADEATTPAPPLARSLATVLIWLAIWLGPLLAIVLATGQGSVFSQLGIFFSKLAVVTFGGAYAVLAYMAQEAVATYGWLAPGEMLDGLGLAETTPGPLIQVVGFVGYLGAYRHPGGLEPWMAGVLGSTLATWCTYAPCFLWIFTGAPYIQWLRHRTALNAALSAITAAVVGVILNLAVWFGLHTLFSQGSALDPFALLLSLAAMLALLRFHVGILPTMTVCGLVGLVGKLLIPGL
ncbi:MAG: hypothetical protein AMXMBFR33_10280 [Candidatus Xenobia bacterium]